MIYILVGTDLKNKNTYLKNIALSSSIIRLSRQETSKDTIIEYANTQSLFGGMSTIVLENILSKDELSLKKDDLIKLQDSKKLFVFFEDKLLLSLEKKYKNYATVEYFEETKIVRIPKLNTFAIADAFTRQDKMNTWILYREAIESGIEPEVISGMLFWKIKIMILTNPKIAHRILLQQQSSALVSLYHLAHRGQGDLTIGLEQFILNTLSK